MKDRYDVVVAGGGPAGSTVAALVAEGGYSVLLLEREPTPPFKVGESLMPATWWTFRRLGLLEQLRSSAFPRKHSVQFFGGSGRASAPFYFSEFDPGESAVTWQVLRSDFDAMMLDNARARGAEIVQGAAVLDVLFEGEKATGVRFRDPGGAVREIERRGHRRRHRPERPAGAPAEAGRDRAESEEGLPLHPLLRGPARRGHRRGRHPDPAHPGEGLLVLVHPPARRPRQRRRRRRPGLPAAPPREAVANSASSTRSWPPARPWANASPRPARCCP